MSKLNYKDSGVDITEGNRAVELMKKSVRSTYTDGVVGDIGLFSGGFSLKAFKDLENPILLASTDGVGTKVMISQMMDKHDSVGIDLVAMCVNDLICQGAKPLFFLDYIATGKLMGEKIAMLVEGIAEGCRQSDCALIGGETAEMPGLYGENEYDLAGFSVGICDEEKLIDGKKISEGDKIIGLKSTGLHSNGYSLARKLFFEELGLSIDDKLENSDKTVGELLLEPTKIYVKTVLKLIEKFEILGISNITGGGFIENIPRILPKNLDAIVNLNSYEKPFIFEFIESTNKIEKSELYRSFNMGIGMILVVKSEIAKEVLNFINESTTDTAFLIGEIIKGEKKCLLRD
ncbi:MAG: phosphoribosylformylglycinamidine cyclo-ligase [Tissierellia bacterium]|nr:phosphoribosylformylglycinamidine cyclo-ligase [Tissierellia bacterium]